MKTLLGANKWVTTGYLNYGDLYNEEQTMVGGVCGWRDTSALKHLNPNSKQSLSNALSLKSISNLCDPENLKAEFLAVGQVRTQDQINIPQAVVFWVNKEQDAGCLWRVIKLGYVSSAWVLSGRQS